ncbi:MAG: adenylyl-sulfate kinase [Fimbriimonas sp.]
MVASEAVELEGLEEEAIYALREAPGQVVAAGTVDRVLPAVRNPLPARVLWLTGLSGAGKSTLAEETVRRLRGEGVDTIHLDGDSLRAGLCSDLGFSPEDRLENVRRAAEVAKLMASQGRPVICSLISPLRLHREEARRILGDAFVEVFVRCPIEECIRRDPKGLYARALSGAIPGFTGIGAPYEEPQAADLVLETDRLDSSACVELLVAGLREGAFA